MGAPCTVEQVLYMLHGVEQLVLQLVRADPLVRTVLGRCEETFGDPLKVTVSPVRSHTNPGLRAL